MEWSIIIFTCLVFGSVYLLLRRNIRKSTKELLEFVERDGIETRKKMSSKTFREWAELSLKNYRQRQEREEAEGLNQSPNQRAIKGDT